MCCTRNVLDLHLQQIFENPGMEKQALDDADLLHIMDRVDIFVGVMQKQIYNRAKSKEYLLSKFSFKGRKAEPPCCMSLLH